VIWFIQVEATFETARITDKKTRAHYVIMPLDAEAISCCRDLIERPDENEPYTKLKERIIESFSASAESQLRQLIKGQVLTSGKHSHTFLIDYVISTPTGRPKQLSSMECLVDYSRSR